MALEPILYQQNAAGAVSQRQRSPALWGDAGDCPWSGIVEGSVPGMYFVDDSFSWAGSAAPTLTTVVNWDKYSAFATSGSTISRVYSINSTAVAGGALQTSLDASTHSASIATASGMFSLTGTTTLAGPLWFEACVAVDVVTANSHGFFLGLAEVDQLTLATAVPFTSNAGTAITNTASAVGFNLPCNGLGQVKTVYSDRATSYTSVGATDATVLSPFVFTRLGMVYDPRANGTSNTIPQTCAIRFYQDNVLLPTGITNATLVATTNLCAKNMGLLFSTIAGSSVSTGLTFLKWWRCAQLIPS